MSSWMQKASLFVALNRVYKSFFQWPILPTKPFQFLWTHFWLIILLFETVAKNNILMELEPTFAKSPENQEKLQNRLCITPWDSCNSGTFPSKFAPDHDSWSCERCICVCLQLQVSRILIVTPRLHHVHLLCSSSCSPLHRIPLEWFKYRVKCVYSIINHQTSKDKTKIHLNYDSLISSRLWIQSIVYNTSIWAQISISFRLWKRWIEKQRLEKCHRRIPSKGYKRKG